MADNLTTTTTVSTVPSGSVIATDDVAGVHFQKVKIDIGGDGASAVLGNSNPLPVSDAGGTLTVDNTVLSVVGGGVEATAQRVTIASDSTGVLSVDDNGGSLTIDGTVAVSGTVTVDSELTTADLDTGAGTDTRAVIGLVGSASGGGQIIPGSSTDGLLVNLGANNDVTVTGTVTANLAAGTNNIGDVDIVSGTITTVSTLTGGGVAHDAADSGNPVKVGAKASATLSDDTMVANADRTDLTSDLDGTLLVRPQYPLGDIITERVSDTGGTSTAFTNFGATASTRSVITAIVCFNSSATAGYVDFRDGAAGSILYTVPLPAGGGAVLSAGGTPYFRTSANTALAYDVSAALTTVYISVTGFKSKV